MIPKKPKTGEQLLKETVKWLEKLREEIKHVKLTKKLDKKAMSEVLENIHAYISDCEHFLKKNDLPNAFEAIVYAWGIYETCLRLDLLGKIQKK